MLGTALTKSDTKLRKFTAVTCELDFKGKSPSGQRDVVIKAQAGQCRASKEVCSWLEPPIQRSDKRPEQGHEDRMRPDHKPHSRPPPGRSR